MFVFYPLGKPKTVACFYGECASLEHNEIVLVAWGRDGRGELEKVRIAELFHEALLGSSNVAPVAHSFKRVTFAISKSSPEDNVFEVFRSRFAV